MSTSANLEMRRNATESSLILCLRFSSICRTVVDASIKSNRARHAIHLSTKEHLLDFVRVLFFVVVVDGVMKMLRGVLAAHRS